MFRQSVIITSTCRRNTTNFAKHAKDGLQVLTTTMSRSIIFVVENDVSFSTTKMIINDVQLRFNSAAIVL